MSLTDKTSFPSNLKLFSGAGNIDYEQSFIFLRDSRVGEHPSARENQIIFSRRRASCLLVRADFHARSRALPRLSLRKMRDCSYSTGNTE